jgi:hypothetical protein
MITSTGGISARMVVDITMLPIRLGAGANHLLDRHHNHVQRDSRW